MRVHITRVLVRIDLACGNSTKPVPLPGHLRVEADLASTYLEGFVMKFMRSVRWLLLALIVFATAAQLRVNAQAPGTLKTGTFVWDGERWIPVETPQPPPPVQVDDEDVITSEDAPPPLPEYEQPPGNWHWGLFGY